MPFNVDAEIDRLQKVIEFGELSTQLAPGGHPLYAALDDARELLTWMRERRDIIPVLPDTQRVPQTVRLAEEAIHGAVASLRVDPDQPLPRTVWPALRDAPWPLLVGGLVAVVLAGYAVGRRA